LITPILNPNLFKKKYRSQTPNIKNLKHGIYCCYTFVVPHQHSILVQLNLSEILFKHEDYEYTYIYVCMYILLLKFFILLKEIIMIIKTHNQLILNMYNLFSQFFCR